MNGDAFSQGERIGYLIGTFLFPVVLGAFAWSKGWKKTGVVVGILLLLSGLSNIGKKGASNAQQVLTGFRTGCVKSCSARDPSLHCDAFCDCISQALRGSRDDSAFAKWLMDHAPGGTPDPVFTAEKDRVAGTCGEKLR